MIKSRTHWRALLLATRFLTRAPLPDPGAPEAGEAGQAVLYYPLVGLLLGGLLALLAGVLTSAPAPLAALLLVTLWVWGTGALHLDGLADCADAWVGGLGDRARTLAILKDPHLGVMGGVALMLALLAKYATLWVLLDMAANHLVALALIPALARLQILLLALTTPGATPTGMGAALRASLVPGAGWAVAAAGWLLVWPWLGWSWPLWLVTAGGSLWL
jgi:adenosylcobinamide-GDP ribazoletransferase